MQREWQIQTSKRVYAGYQAEEVIGWFIRTDGSLLFSEEQAAATMLPYEGPAQVQTIFYTLIILLVDFPSPCYLLGINKFCVMPLCTFIESWFSNDKDATGRHISEQWQHRVFKCWGGRNNARRPGEDKLGCYHALVDCSTQLIWWFSICISTDNNRPKT